MTQRMPDWIKFPLVLAITCSISAASLAAVKALTGRKQLSVRESAFERALKEVIPEADSFEERKGKVAGRDISYRIAKREGRTIGFVTVGEASGYSSVITVMAAVNPDYSIRSIKVISQNETPGLGDKIMEVLSKETWATVVKGSVNKEDSRPWFQVQFAGKRAPVAIKKDGGEIEAITGATISSRAVCSAVNKAIDDLKTVLVPGGY